MSNLIEATVYQIDGNPQKDIITVAFDTNKIRLQETTVSTIPAVNAFIEVEGEKLNAPVVRYFVSETVATLVSAANTGGTTLLQATVVAINENPFKVAKQMAFPANKVTVWSFSNGNIQSFLQLNEDKFYAGEDKATLVAAANAGGGGGGGITEATNGLTISDDIAVGLGSSLTQPETVIEGNTFLWRTTSQDNQQGFYLNFGGEIYSFGIEQNNDGDAAYTTYTSNNIFTQIYNNNSLGSITINHGANDYFITREYDYYDGNLTSYNILLANYFETNLRHSLTFVDDEENTIVVDGRIRIICDEQQLVHYNLLNCLAYANNEAALEAGLIVGDIYRVTGTGNLNIVF